VKRVPPVCAWHFNTSGARSRSSPGGFTHRSPIIVGIPCRCVAFPLASRWAVFIVDPVQSKSPNMLELRLSSIHGQIRRQWNLQIVNSSFRICIQFANHTFNSANLFCEFYIQFTNRKFKFPNRKFKFPNLYSSFQIYIQFGKSYIQFSKSYIQFCESYIRFWDLRIVNLRIAKYNFRIGICKIVNRKIQFDAAVFCDSQIVFFFCNSQIVFFAIRKFTNSQIPIQKLFAILFLLSNKSMAFVYSYIINCYTLLLNYLIAKPNKI
jgi:hypothetical protein